jgi:hypothetical protein
MKKGCITGSVILASALACPGLWAQEGKPCLSYAYPEGQVPASETSFDTMYDSLNVHHASFSCGPAIAASRAREALEAFRVGVLFGDKARLDSVLNYPLTVRVQKTLEVGEKPKVIVVKSFQEWEVVRREEMNKLQIAAIACSWLGNVTVATSRTPGFFIGPGMVWFQRQSGSARVMVTSINLLPLTSEMLVNSCAP